MQQAQLPTAQKQALPPEVSQLAAASQVGAVVNEYQSDAVTRMLSGLVLSVFGGGGTLLLIYLLVTRPINDGALGLLLFTLLLLGYGMASCRRAWRNRRARVYLCAQGVMRLEGSRGEAMRWDQVVELSKVFGGGGASYLYSYLNRYVLRRIDGTALSIDKAFRRFDELSRYMEEAVTKRLLPGALAAYEGGGYPHLWPNQCQRPGRKIAARAKDAELGRAEGAEDLQWKAHHQGKKGPF